MLEPANTWQSKWAEVPTVGNDSWKQNLAAYIDARLTGKLTTATVLKAGGSGAMAFTFAKGAFVAALADNKPATLSAAFKAALLASTAVVAPGAFIGSDSPASKFATVASTLIVPASAEAAAAKLAEVMGLAPQKEAGKSQFPLKLREAALLVKVAVSGINSVPPPAGPQPLTLAAGGVQ